MFEVENTTRHQVVARMKTFEAAMTLAQDNKVRFPRFSYIIRNTVTGEVTKVRKIG